MRVWVTRLRASQLNLDLVLGLAHLHAAADPVHRNRVAVGVQRDIAFDVHHALVQPVDLGNPGRQRLQVQPLDREQLAGNRADMFLVRGVDLVAPLARLLIQILPTGERAPGQKVVLDEPEGPFHARRTVGIADLMRHELKPEALAQRRPSRAPEPSRGPCRAAPPRACCRS